MKKITYLLLILTATIGNISFANLIESSKLYTPLILTQNLNSDSFEIAAPSNKNIITQKERALNKRALNNNSKNTITTPVTETANISLNTVQTELTIEKTFDQELQWRILNLLAQQLFDNNDQQLSDSLFLSSRIYKTKTFTVSITSNDPDYYQVKITDSQRKENNTQLEIPRL
jgi:hypothetical protein